MKLGLLLVGTVRVMIKMFSSSLQGFWSGLSGPSLWWWPSASPADWFSCMCNAKSISSCGGDLRLTTEWYMCKIGPRPIKRLFSINLYLWSQTWKTRRLSGQRSQTQTLRSTQRLRTTAWRYCTSEQRTHSPIPRDQMMLCLLPGYRWHHTALRRVTETELLLFFRCFLCFVCSVPVSCWLAIMSRCAPGPATAIVLLLCEMCDAPLELCASVLTVYVSVCLCAGSNGVLNNAFKHFLVPSFKALLF